MASLQRNQTTAAEASALWICTTHAMREEEPRQARCSRRRELPLSQKRQDFLTLYQEEQVSDTHLPPSRTPSCSGPGLIMIHV